MADFYSNLFTNPAANGTLVRGYKSDVGLDHGRLRVSAARVTALMTSGDVARMITLKAGSRLERLYYATDGVAGAGAVNLGLYETGQNHDGAVVEPDIFSAGTSASAGAAYVDLLTGGALEDEDRMKTLWEMADEGSATYTENPGGNFDIALTCSTTFTTTAPEILLVAHYTAGD